MGHGRFEKALLDQPWVTAVGVDVEDLAQTCILEGVRAEG